MLQRENLYTYQREAIEFIKKHEACALAIDCGLGKTSTTLTAFSDMLGSFDARRMLVVAPLRVARKVWSDEISEWSHLQELTISPIIGTLEQRMAALRKPADIHTINRENLQWLHAQFIQNKKQIMRWPWGIVAIDESQSMKSQSAKRWKAMRELRTLTQRIVLLSGTIMPNGYEDLWAQYALIDRGKRLGWTKEAFLERWFDRPTRQTEFDKWVPKAHAAKEIQEAVADITLSLRAEDYLDLPPVVYNPVRVQLSHAAMQVYKKMEKTYLTEVKGKTLTAVNRGALDNKLLQLANGVVYTGEGREYVEFHEEKLEALKELLESISGKVLVAYYYRHDLERIKRVLAGFGRRWALLREDAEFDAWANGEYEVGVLHPASCGHGLNTLYKSGAQDMVHYGVSANLELYIQANDRLAGGHRRVGRNVKIHNIIADRTRDEDYLTLLNNKAATQDELTRSLANRIRQA